MKLYSVFVDIGSHSDGWEPEDETDDTTDSSGGGDDDEPQTPSPKIVY